MEKPSSRKKKSPNFVPTPNKYVKQHSMSSIFPSQKAPSFSELFWSLYEDKTINPEWPFNSFFLGE